MKAVHTCAEGNACMHARAWAQRPMQVGQSFLLGLGSPEPAHDGTGAGQAGGAAHPEIGRRRLSTFCKKTNLCSGCQAPRWSLVWLEKCQPIVLRLSHARIRLSGRYIYAHLLAPRPEDDPWHLMQPAFGIHDGEHRRLLLLGRHALRMAHGSSAGGQWACVRAREGLSGADWPSREARRPRREPFLRAPGRGRAPTFEVRVFRTLPPSLPTRNLRPGD